MAYQNPLVTLILLSSILISCVTGGQLASELDPKAIRYSIGQQEVLAQDSITITITEVNYATAFMDSIPKLKSIGNLKGEQDEVLQCVGGLTSAMKNVLGEVQKLEAAFQIPPLYLGTGPLMNVVNVILNYNVICERALGDIDGTIKLMVMRKIEEVVMLSNDVMLRLSNLQMISNKVTRKTLN